MAWRTVGWFISYETSWFYRNTCVEKPGVSSIWEVMALFETVAHIWGDWISVILILIS